MYKLEKVTVQDQNKLESVLWQLRECWNDIRQYDTLVWQIPSFTTVINGGLIVFSSTADFFTRTTVIFLITFLTLVLTIALAKHQYFRIYRFREMENLQKNLIDLGIPIMVDGARSTSSVQEALRKGIFSRIPQGWIYRRTAYNWIYRYMIIMLGFLVFLFIYNLILWVSQTSMGVN